MATTERDAPRPIRVGYLFNVDVRPYRSAFLDALARREDLDITLYVGKPPPSAGAPAEDVPPPPFAVRRLRNVFWPRGGVRVLWQGGALSMLWSKADVLVIPEQVHTLSSLALRLLHRVFGKQLVLHGFFYRSDEGRLAAVRDRLRAWLHKTAAAYIAYSDRGKSEAMVSGLPPQRIFVAQNTIDTAQLAAVADSLSETDIATARNSLNLSGSVIVYLGRLLPEKRPQVAVETLRRLLENGLSLSLLVVGDGSERGNMERVAADLPVSFVGAEYRAEAVACYLRLGDVLLLPGRVGLTPLDAFACGIPVVASSDPTIAQSPEFEYLVSDQNCLLVPRATPAEFARAISRLLADESLRSRLVDAGRKSALSLSVESMAASFADAIYQASQDAVSAG